MYTSNLCVSKGISNDFLRRIYPKQQYPRDIASLTINVDGIHYSTPIAVPSSHYRKVDQLIRHFVDPPIVRKLQKKTILMVGDLALLTCEVSGVPEPLVKWSKDGDNDITRARLKSNGRILVIENVIPGDSGVYECKASNKFGENRTATTVIVAGKFLKMYC